MYREPLHFLSKGHHAIVIVSCLLYSNDLKCSPCFYSFYLQSILCIVSRVILKKKTHKLYQATSLLLVLWWLPILWSEVQTPYHIYKALLFYGPCLVPVPSTPTTETSLLLLQHAKHTTSPGPLHLLLSLSGTLSTLIAQWLILSLHLGLCFS